MNGLLRQQRAEYQGFSPFSEDLSARRVLCKDGPSNRHGHHPVNRYDQAALHCGHPPRIGSFIQVED
ncbi:hypothetical protein RvY_18630 [Ramazzottius varieornatus]|uniref:Uncharacterized protein n=1 Tax=Ramazzottius varieornatus TaxID=947166 RepID=A0A1D1W6R9_RAMVA|nr:hypothetical protein RvY_18630 [Ramazzottius varieornatus]